MDIRTVMCVFGVERWDQDIKFAIDFCETQGAHLTALVTCLGGVPAIATYEAISTAWLDEQRAEIERLAEAAKQVQEILEKTELSFEVQEIYTEFAWADDDIAKHALVGREELGSC